MLLAGFFACVISFWLLVYCIPIFIIGALIIFFSKKSLKTKFISIIAPIVLYLPLTYISLIIFTYTSPKTFLIPLHYEGTLRIVYEEKCGLKPEKENGRQILRFPKNGLLILSNDFDGGVNNNYFLVDDRGNRKEVNEVLEFKNRVYKMPAILNGGSGTLFLENSSGSNDKSIKSITYSDFFLYNNDTTNIGNDRIRETFDSLTRINVEACRANR